MWRKIGDKCLKLIAKRLTNLGCQLGGFPTIDHLEQQLSNSNSELQEIEEQEKALYRVVSKIRASLDLDIIFQTTTKETCKLLQVERVAVYRFFDDWSGEFISDFEFAKPGWEDLGQLGKNTVWRDTYLQETQGGRYRYNETLTVSDLYKTELSPCHVEILEQFQIRAYATAPIFIGNRLWGILAAYQHSQPLQWQPRQIKFLSQVATQLGCAVKQADLLSETQQKAEALRENNEQQRILFELIAEIRESIDLNTLFKTTVRETRKALQVDRVGIFQFEPGSHYNRGEFVAENVLPEYDSAMAWKVEDHCFGDQYAIQYEKGRMQVVSNIYQAGLKSCHLNLLEEFQIQAQIIVPVLKRGSLWGLLCIHQCREPRQWKTTEIQFAKQLAAQFSVALDHAELLDRYRAQTEQLNETVEQLEQANTKLEELTCQDALTQVSNRRFFDQVLDKEWKRSIRTGQYVSLILFDLDYFKQYNDYYGHPAGDDCLIKIAQAAQSILKRPTDILSRYGGEEFAVILPHTDPSGAVQIAQQIHQAITELQIPHARTQTAQPIVTVSLGIASQVATVEQSPQNLIDRADQSLYQAKNQGRNTWVSDQNLPPTTENRSDTDH
jgi:diguanylate cyclase (GGDEF)-like protein